MKILKSGLLLSLSLCIVLCSGVTVYALDSNPGEYEVKAAFLLNFINFVEWPQDGLAHSPVYTICVLGNNPFGTALRTIQDKVTAGKRVVTRVCKNLQDTRSCHMLFVSSSEKDRLGSILEETNNLGILTVGDMKGFAHAGGIIQFVIEENKVRFIVNVDAANRSKIRISSKLLRLARIFRE